MDWDKLRVFHAVAEAGSFTRAGEALNLSQSAVSRQVSSLEESLNVTLFHRHARGLYSPRHVRHDRLEVEVQVKMLGANGVLTLQHVCVIIDP